MAARQPSPAIAQCLNAGYGFLEVKCKRCDSIWVRGPLKITLTFQWAYFALTLS
jgi:hypothetical protein